MTEHDRDLSKERRQQAIRRELRKNDSALKQLAGRIGRLAAFPPGPNDDVKRYRHGVALIVVAIFVLLLTGLFLPRDNGRWMFGVFGFVLAMAGAWQIDKARR